MGGKSKTLLIRGVNNFVRSTPFSAYIETEKGDITFLTSVYGSTVIVPDMPIPPGPP